MNAIIGLCHFCDEHGPRTLFCTQAFKFIDSNGDGKYTPPPPQQQQQQQQQTCDSPTQQSPQQQVTCKACRAFDKTFFNYISYDNSSNICYISQSTPSDPEVFSMVRKACLRTLHCEVFDDPIYFDDDTNGSAVIGYEFHIKDIEGRGQQRSYSLIVLMKDRIYLQHLWLFLQANMQIIAGRLKSFAFKLFENELKSNPDRANPFIYQQNGIKTCKKSANKTKRGLIELTNDAQIFCKLHMWFTWLLRASAMRLREEFFSAPLIEDTQFRIEQTKYLNELDNELTQKTNCLYENFDDLNIKLENFRDLIKLISFEKFHIIAFNVVIGNQVMVRSRFKTLVYLVLRILEELIPYGCRRCIYYSNDYEKSYKCNLLGLSEKFNVKDNLSMIEMQESQGYVLVDMNITEGNNNNLSSNSPIYANYKCTGGICKTFVTTNVNFENNAIIVPQILSRIEEFILNELIDINTMNALIRWVREEWLNKAKVLYKYKTSTMAKTKSNKSMDDLLKILKLEKKDEMALKFWQTGLSNCCKTQIRSS